MLELKTLPTGEFGTNCYLLRCPRTHRGLLIDPGADPDKVLAMCAGTDVGRILLTHGHWDHHVLGLKPVQATLDVPVGIHPADAAAFELQADFDLYNGQLMRVGHFPVNVVHIPGHTPGGIALRFDRRAVVGDSIFPGGPGASHSPGALETLLLSLQRTIFTWPDDTVFYPGHGEPGIVGEVRPVFQAFLARPRSADLHGDVAWEG